MRSLLILLCFAAAGCSVPFTGGPQQDRKAPCDQLAAQAIQTPSLEEARQLAAHATECYAAATGQRR